MGHAQPLQVTLRFALGPAGCEAPPPLYKRVKGPDEGASRKLALSPAALNAYSKARAEASRSCAISATPLRYAGLARMVPQ